MNSVTIVKYCRGFSDFNLIDKAYFSVLSKEHPSIYTQGGLGSVEVGFRMLSVVGINYIATG